MARRREHSRKPDEAYERIEALVPGPYLERFARERHPGWEVMESPEADIGPQQRRWAFNSYPAATTP
jgi:N6-adenosine-specific RNA methylase IME4